MYNEELMKIRSQRVNSAIAKCGLTFIELERRTGIPHSTLQRYVSGTTDKIPVTFYEAIASVTGEPVEYLLAFDKKSTPSLQGSAASKVMHRVAQLSDHQIDILEGYLDGLERK